MRIVKYFCYEGPFLKRKSFVPYSNDVTSTYAITGLSELRKNEVRWISRMNYMRSAK
jgi:hypothetical protein